MTLCGLLLCARWKEDAPNGFLFTDVHRYKNALPHRSKSLVLQTIEVNVQPNLVVCTVLVRACTTSISLTDQCCFVLLELVPTQSEKIRNFC